MSAKAISEQTGKELLYKYICTTSAIQNRFKYARVTPDTDWAHLLQDHPWLLSQVSPPPGLSPSSRPRVPGRESSRFAGDVPPGHVMAAGLHGWAGCRGLSTFCVWPRALHAEVPWHGVQSLDWNWTNRSSDGSSLHINHVAWGKPFHLTRVLDSPSVKWA